MQFKDMIVVKESKLEREQAEASVTRGVTLQFNQGGNCTPSLACQQDTIPYRANVDTERQQADNPRAVRGRSICLRSPPRRRDLRSLSEVTER